MVIAMVRMLGHILLEQSQRWVRLMSISEYITAQYIMLDKVYEYVRDVKQ